MEQRPPYKIPQIEQQSIYHVLQERLVTQGRMYQATPRPYTAPMNIGRNFPRQQ